jgi:glycosyltransferase involved in cell wall biosynthesis
MRVGYDEQVFLAQRRGGISRYVVSLVEAFRAAPELGIDAVPGWRWSDNEHSAAAGLSRRLPLPQRDGLLTVAGQGAYFLANTGRRRRARQADILHHTYFHPRFLSSRSAAKQVTTVHDMIPELYPETFDGRNPHLAKREYVQRSDLVLCVSQSAKEDLLAVYGDLGVPIRVIHHGVGSGFSPHLGPPADPPGRYLLFVGKRSGYKDFGVLLEAFADLGDPTLTLIAAGGDSFTAEENRQISAAHLQGRVQQRPASDEELRRLYAHAELFVFPSRHEGFGLPTLEAMASGTPVLLANSSSHPEAGGDVAVYFPPGDPAALSTAMASLLQDPARRAALGTAGVARAAGFTWDAAARATAAAYRSILDSPGL